MIVRIIFGGCCSLLLLRRDCCCRLGTVQGILLLFHHNKLVPPNAARVILRARDDGIALIVERARENLVCVPLKHLQTVARLDLPQASRLVARRR